MSGAFAYGDRVLLLDQNRRRYLIELADDGEFHSHAGLIAHEDLVVTRADDIMVVRYFLRIDETIDGAEIESRAPRLTAFRKIDGAWKAVSHANFGATAPPQ